MATFNTVTITNQLATAIDIYDQFDPSTTAQPDQPFTYTKLGTIAAGGIGEVQTIRQVALLVATVTGPFSEMAGRYYYQFPVKLMSGTQVTFGDPPPLAYTVTSSDQAAAVLSFQFHRFAMANPASALTRNFNNALKSGFAAVNTFFAGTANFKTCTMGTWHMVMTWLSNFTSGWQGPYYLYETPPSPLPADYAPNLVATVNIQSDATTNSAVLTLCTADAAGNPRFTSPPQQSTLVMAGGSVMQDANPGADIPVSLTPVWMNVIQTPMENGTPTPKYLIGSGLNGTVGSTNVVSSQTARQVPGKPATKSAAENSTFDKILSKGSEIIGALAGLVAVYEFVKKKFEKGEAAKEKAKSEAKDPEDLKAKEDAADAEVQAEVTDPKDGVAPLEAASQSDAASVSDGYSATVTEMRADTMRTAITDKVDAIESQVQTDLENGDTPSQSFEDAWSDLQTKSQSALESIDNGDLSSWTGDFDTSLSNLDQVVQTSETDFSQSVSDLQTSYNEATEQSKSLDDAGQEYDTESEDSTDDSGYNSDDDTTPPETDEIPVDA